MESASIDTLAEAIALLLENDLREGNAQEARAQFAANFLARQSVIARLRDAFEAMSHGTSDR